MPKYLMVFDSDKVIPDDEFEQIVRPSLLLNPGFKFEYAMNCEGVRKELWDIATILRKNIHDEISFAAPEAIYDKVDIRLADSVNDISNLFKI